jgi:hypothetical protein
LQTLHLRLEGCTIKVTPDLLHETAQQLGHLKHLSMKDVRVTNLAGLLEKCYNLREFKFHSLQNSDVLSTFAYQQRTPHLHRVCVYTHFTPSKLT